MFQRFSWFHRFSCQDRLREGLYQPVEIILERHNIFLWLSTVRPPVHFFQYTCLKLISCQFVLILQINFCEDVFTCFFPPGSEITFRLGPFSLQGTFRLLFSRLKMRFPTESRKVPWRPPAAG